MPQPAPVGALDGAFNDTLDPPGAAVVPPLPAPGRTAVTRTAQDRPLAWPAIQARGDTPCSDGAVRAPGEASPNDARLLPAAVPQPIDTAIDTAADAAADAATERAVSLPLPGGPTASETAGAPTPPVMHGAAASAHAPPALPEPGLEAASEPPDPTSTTIEEPLTPAPATAVPARAAPAVAAALPSAPVAITPRATAAQKWLLVLAVLALIKFAKVVLLPITLAVVLSFVLAPPQRRLRKAGLPDMAAAALLVGMLLVAVGVLGSLVAGPAAQWWDRAPATLRQLIDTVDRARSSVPGLEPPPVPQPSRRAAAMPPPADPIHEKLADEGYTITRAVVSQLASLGASAAATIVLLLFLLGSQHWLLMRTVQAIPRTRVRALLLAGLRQAEREIGLFLGTMGIINLALGLATFAAMAAVGMPNPLLWGVLAGMLNFMPYVGPVLMAGILLLAGVLTFGLTGMTAVPAAVFFAIHLLESALLTPWVLGRRLLLSPLSVSLSIMLWAWLWGEAGALLAVPMLLALRTVAKRTRGLKVICGYLEGQPPNAPSLRSLLRNRKRTAPLPRATS